MVPQSIDTAILIDIAARCTSAQTRNSRPEDFKMAVRLASETSPYLLQHLDNPVDWHPWGPVAMQLAS